MQRIIPFTPARVDDSDDNHIVVGTLGELAKISAEGKLASKVSTPFPAGISCSTAFEGAWLGIWVEPEMRLARMASLDIEADWQDGATRSALRTSDDSTLVHPAEAIWSRSLDAEPTAVCQVEGGFCFALRSRGVYRMDIEAKEIWRASMPSVIDGKRRGQETAISMSVSGEILRIWFDNGLVVDLSMEDGSELDRRNLRVGERIEAVFHSKNEHLLALSTGGIARTNAEQVLESHPTSGPVMAARYQDGAWEFTGWRIDGRLFEGILEISKRTEIGVGFVGQRVLTNDGTLADFPFTRS
ncbi:TPA: hypothetical protein HA325_03725 [Candidatus Thalassarchaeaceae archaeon]|nr:hypothetical protein [Candidatus Thalassarchaeaceae archaeon]